MVRCEAATRTPGPSSRAPPRPEPGLPIGRDPKGPGVTDGPVQRTRHFAFAGLPSDSPGPDRRSPRRALVGRPAPALRSWA